MKDINKAINEFLDKEKSQPEIEVDLKGIPVKIKIKTTLSLSEINAFVDEVATKCFVDGEYYPALCKPLFYAGIIDRFTNIDLPVAKITDKNGNETEYTDLDKCVEIIERLNLISLIRAEICELTKREFDLIGYLDEMIQEKIEYIKRKEFSKSSAEIAVEELFLLLNDIRGFINNLSETVQPAIQKMIVEGILESEGNEELKEKIKEFKLD